MMSGAFFCLLSAHSSIVAVPYVRLWCVFASQNHSKRCLLLCSLNPLALQNVWFHRPKGMLLPCKTIPFALQYVCFCIAKRAVSSNGVCSAAFYCSVCRWRLSHGMALPCHTLIGRWSEPRKQFEVFCKSCARLEPHTFCYGLYGVCPIACWIVESAARFPNAETR